MHLLMHKTGDTHECKSVIYAKVFNWLRICHRMLIQKWSRCCAINAFFYVYVLLFIPIDGKFAFYATICSNTNQLNVLFANLDKNYVHRTTGNAMFLIPEVQTSCCSYFAFAAWRDWSYPTAFELYNKHIVKLCRGVYQDQIWFIYWFVAWGYQLSIWTNVGFSLERFYGIHLLAISQRAPKLQLMMVI